MASTPKAADRQAVTTTVLAAIQDPATPQAPLTRAKPIPPAVLPARGYGAQDQANRASEVAALSRFFSKHWNVRFKAQPDFASFRTGLAQLLSSRGLDGQLFERLATAPKGADHQEQLLQAVVAYGIVFGDAEALTQAPAFARKINWQCTENRQVNGALFALSKVWDPGYDDPVDPVETLAQKHLGLTAAPKGYKAFKNDPDVDEYGPPTPESADYDGRPFHEFYILGGAPMGERLCRQTVYYNQQRGDSPANTLLGGAFVAGTSHAYHAVDASMVGYLRANGIDVGDRF